MTTPADNSNKPQAAKPTEKDLGSEAAESRGFRSKIFRHPIPFRDNSKKRVSATVGWRWQAGTDGPGDRGGRDGGEAGGAHGVGGGQAGGRSAFRAGDLRTG